MPPLTARHKVLDALARRHPATAAQLARALSMSVPTVRHHLRILVADGRVVAERKSALGGRGRPETHYRPADVLLGENSALLADAMLSSWLSSLSPSEQEAALLQIAGRIASAMGPAEAGLSASKRLVQVVERLSRLHYRAGWEAGAQGPRIFFEHCPYAALVGKHPELCRMDALVLSGQLGADSAQTAKIGEAGSKRCVFTIRGRPFGD